MARYGWRGLFVFPLLVPAGGPVFVHFWLLYGMGETTGVSSLGCRCGAGTLGRSGERALLGALDWAFRIILWQLVLREMMPSGF